MSIDIIQHREWIETEHARLRFDYVGENGWGFSFECAPDGTVDMAIFADRPDALANYQACLAGNVNGLAVVKCGVERFTTRYRQERLGRCYCGEVVGLDDFTNTCDGCGRDYNGSGCELAPRSQWGEETGESYADITAPGDPFDGNNW